MVTSEDPLVERFRSARQALGIPQKTAAKILGVGQKQVSDYELGVSLPNEKMVALLERRVAEKRAILGTLTDSSRSVPTSLPSEDTPLLLSDERFYGHVQQFVADWEAWRRRPGAADDRCEFFAFGPERLPVFVEQRDQNLWSANLRKQVNYHLFGLLDELSPSQIQDAFMTLRRIESRAVEGNAGIPPLSRIHIHGIIVNPGRTGEGEEPKRVQNLYGSLVNDGQDSANSVCYVNSLVSVQERPEWLRAVRLGGPTPLMVGRVQLLLEGRSLDLEVMPPVTFAARREENVSLTPDGMKQTGWLFLDRRTTLDLVKYIDAIMPNGVKSQSGTKA